MLSKEFIFESSGVRPGISKILTQKGYTFLGKGQDMHAWLEPNTGLILKIFGAQNEAPGKLTRAQQSFKDFADYCQANPDNPFLPQFYGWETFQFEDETYLQIRIERLFSLGSQGLQGWGYSLEAMSEAADANPTEQGKANFVRNYVPETLPDGETDNIGDGSVEMLELLTHLGEEGFNTLWKTLCDLVMIGRKKRYILDLHDKNFMVGNDGHIVISDPFYVP